jgi:hypothetical protein
MSMLLRRARIWLVLVSTGGGLLILDGCDPGVRNTVLNGVGSAATSLTTTLIQAAVQSLSNQGQDAAATTTV